MLRRFVAVLALALAATLGLATASQAYPAPPAPSAAVSDGTVAPGQGFTFSASGFRPGSTVVVEVAGITRTLTADAQGRISTTFDIDQAGTFTVRATGVNAAGEPVVVNSSVVVAATAAGGGSDDGTAGSGSGLPRTGAEGTALQVWAGIGLLGLGAGMVALTVARRREGAGTIA